MAAQIDSMRTAVTEAVVRKNAARLSALFAEDAVVLEPSGRILEDRAAIEARIGELLPTVEGYSLTSCPLERARPSRTIRRPSS